MNGFTVVEAGTVDLQTGEVRGPRPTRLSPNERRLLAHLVAHPGEVVDKGSLLAEIWGLPRDSPSRTLFATIERLRRKIEVDPKHPRHVLTVGRSGYAFKPMDVPDAPAPAVDPHALMGRGALVAAVSQALAPGRLVTLKGPGGVGKTRLAREICAGWPGSGAVFCELTHVDGGSDAAIVAAIARAAQLPLSGDSDRDLVRIGRVLGGGVPTLLVLDNAEPLATDLARVIGGWPSPTHAPRPPLLVTSRVPLGVSGEDVHAVEPLDGRSGAALFLARARQRAPDLGGVDDEVLQQLVAGLDGLPLAIELAARWATVMSPRQILERLQTRRLPLEDTDRPARHQSLQATLRGSWDILDPAQQRALARCGVFRGGFDLPAAEAVLGSDALWALDALVDRSLLGRQASRFVLLEGIRHFALDRLQEDPEEAQQAQQRHAAHYGRLGGAAQLAAVQRGGTHRLLAVEQANLTAVVASGSPEDAGRAALALASLQRALGPLAPSVDLLQGVLARGALPPRIEAQLWTALGIARRYAADPAGGFVALERGVALAEDTAPEHLGDALEALGVAHMQHGTPTDASAHLDRALTVFREGGDVYGEAIVIAEFAGVNLREGQAVEAARGYQDALRLLRRIGARVAEAIYLGNLGVAQMKAGQFEAARSSLTEALALHRELGSVRFEGQTLTNLGLLHVFWDRTDAGITYYEAALAACAKTGDLKGEGVARANLAWQLLRQGDLATARRHLDAASDAFDELEMPLHRADTAITRAILCRLEGDLESATRYLDRAETMATEHALAELTPSIRGQQGLVALMEGDRGRAAALCADGEASVASLGLKAGTDAANTLADLRDRLDAKGSTRNEPGSR